MSMYTRLDNACRNADHDEKGLREFYEAMVDELGAAFHPDTPAADYVRAGQHVFPPGIALLIDAALDRVSAFSLDVIYKVAFDVVRDHMRECERNALDNARERDR